MRVDFHSHILPGMDDGAANIDESLALLSILADSKVDKVILTPHFYRQNEKIDTFLARREESFRRLSEAAGEVENCPELLLGAEVYFFGSLCNDPDFDKLCISGTDYILLELPFEKFQDNFYREYANFVNRCSQKLLLAHIERYLSFGNSQKDIMRLFDYGDVICQMNCASLSEEGFLKRRKYLRLINDGIISVIGTDTHNTRSRSPKYREAEEIIVSKCGRGAFKNICINSENILENCRLSEIV